MGQSNGKLNHQNVNNDGDILAKINTDYETIYIDDDNNRWYFPYDNSKFHYHEEGK